MLGKFSNWGNKAIPSISLSVIALLAYNNWLLGPYLNYKLFSKNGSVSEFSALTQPHFLVFRSLDILAGLLMIALAFVLARRMPARSWSRNTLIGGTAVLGLANILDASFALRCSETLDKSCQIPVSLSFSNYQVPSHAYSSVIIATCYLLLPLAGLVYAHARKANIFRLFSLLAVAFALESLTAALIQYYSNQSFGVRASGSSQELQMLVLAAWFICWTWSVSINQQLQPKEQTGKEATLRKLVYRLVYEKFYRFYRQSISRG